MLLAVVVVALVGACWLAWQMWVDPEVPFLSTFPPAEWVNEATELTSDGHSAGEREVVFRKAFWLTAVPTRASLRVRVYRAGDVRLNGRETGIVVGRDENWKRVRELEVTALLRPGENEIVVRTRSNSGPAAAWLVLEGMDLLIVSDASWSASATGETARPVRLATTPMSAWAGARQPSNAALDAGRTSLPWLASFALVAILVLFASRNLRELRGRWLVAASAFAIGLLAWHNRGLDWGLGFDASGHFDYVRFILSKHRLPLASDGWSMYHPPLYYAASAAVVALFDWNILALRSLNAVAVVVQCAAILGSLRILFPAEPRRILVGFVLATFVPMGLYMAQFVTNEVWTAALSSAALWLSLRIITRDDRSVAAHLALGTLLGAALLTKFSALLVSGIVLAVLCGRLLARDERSPRAWLTSVGAVVLALVVVSGWHYARVAWNFGSPIVGNWEASTGFHWWQDPGYHTIWDYLRFGDSLTHPIFSAWNGCPDALYSTLWGDGMFSGWAFDQRPPPPWRYELMFPGYWLALVPSAGLVIGLGAALSRLVREPQAEWLLLLGVAAATAFAFVSLSLRLPFYGQCKAFYGLSALVPFAALGGLGLDLVATRLGRLRSALWILVGIWALCSYATYWAR